MLTPWKESYDQPDSMLKSRDITVPAKVHLVKARCEGAGWTKKKTEHQKLMLLNCGFREDS